MGREEIRAPLKTLAWEANDRDDRRIFGGLKFSFSGLFLVGKLGKYFFGSLI